MAEVRKLGYEDILWGTGSYESPAGVALTEINAGSIPINQGDGTLTVNDALTHVFNVKAYGAAGDGTTDDTTAIQDAINAAMPYCEDSTGYRKGAIVYFPQGEYLVTTSLDATTAIQDSESLTLRGAGKRATMITAVLGSSGPVLDLTGQLYPRVEHLSIESRSASSQATAVVLIAENPANDTYSNRHPVFEDAYLLATSPNIVATLMVYNGDLLVINNTNIWNGSGTDAICLGPHIPTTVTSNYQTFGTRLDATEYYINNSFIVGGHAIRMYGGPTLNMSSCVLTRISPVGSDDAIIVLESDTSNAPSVIAHALRTENQTTDTGVSFIRSKGANGISVIDVSGDIQLVDTSGNLATAGFIKSAAGINNIHLRVKSDSNDPSMFDVTGLITNLQGFSDHISIGTVTGGIRSINFNPRISRESDFITSLDGSLEAQHSGIVGGYIVMENAEGTVMRKVRLNTAGDGFVIW